MTSRKQHRDNGSATVEVVLATPLFLFLLMIVVQAGIWAHASHCARTAAHRAVEAARLLDSTAAAGHTTGTETITALASEILTDPHVTVERTATQVTVTVTGTATSVVPGMAWSVRAEATGPVERFIPETAEP